METLQEEIRKKYNDYFEKVKNKQYKDEIEANKDSKEK